jgi:catechol 2,3-dioxygenase-like lactoylglutathione lyase family enzyme
MGTGVRFSHVVANVSDPDRAADFWEVATTLRRTTRTPAPEQSFRSLDIAQGRFDGWLMRDPRAPGGPAIHLWGWRSPEPTGKPYPAYWHVGLFRICTAADAASIYRDVLAAGGKPFTELIMPEAERVAGRPSFCVPDPDGVVLQHVTAPGTPRLSHVALNPRNLAASVAFYEGLGLTVHHTLSTDIPVAYPFGPGGELATFEAAIMQAPGAPEYDGRPVFCLDLCRWKQPAPIGAPYRAQTNLGLVRLGLCVDDLDGLAAGLAARGVAVSTPEVRDFGAEAGTRRAIVTRDPDGVLVEIFDRPL